nr:purine-cytosine permease fcyb [Quercus suber]
MTTFELDPEKAQHGEPSILPATPPQRDQRPLTTQEKLEATRINVDSTGSSTTSFQSNSSSVHRIRGFFTKIGELEAVMDRKLGIESDAIERKTAEDRRPQPWHAQLNMALLWASGTMNLSCFVTGFLGWEFGLDLTQSICIYVFASILGGAVSGFCATMGPATGLRQISISRYSMGWWPNKLIAALNIIQQIGWSAAGCITGGLALQAVSDGTIPIAVGVVIIGVVSMIICLVGLRAILVYQKYAWFVYLVIFLIIFGQTGRYANNLKNTEAILPGDSGTVLSLIAIVYGSSASWSPVVSDYYVHYPVDVSRTKVWILTTLGVGLPTAFGLVAGAVVSSTLNTQTEWLDVYDNEGVGFLIQTMLHPRGFAKFLLVLLVLSGVNMNIINTYSCAISCQQFSRPFAKVPRIFWTLLCFGVIVALAIAGRNQLLAYLQNFLALLGYWCTSYFVIIFSEHYIFRKGNFANYDLDGWNDPKRLPLGLAAFGAFALGVIAWVMGMVETWYVGPLGSLIGGAGGDVANQFAFVVTAVSFTPLRFLELKYVGR